MHFDCVIIGAGAAGMMCGAIAGARRRTVALIDHAQKPGEKIRISGGGRCNFTNLHCGPDNFISQNPHFCRSALARYGPYDFIELVESYGISWHEKQATLPPHLKNEPTQDPSTKGQLFCDGRSQQIIDMLVSECEKASNQLWLGTQVLDIRKNETGGFHVTTDRQAISCESLVIACGGASIPKMGATSYGYKVAKSFGLNVITPEPGLVPLTFTDSLKDPLKALSGVSVYSRISHENPNGRATEFEDALLFTHRGLSGPAILQISSYWQAGEAVTLNLAPHISVFESLKAARDTAPRQSPANWAAQYIPERLARMITSGLDYERLADMSDIALRNLALMINAWRVKPAGSEGFRTAEVTKGGVDTNALSSKTMQARNVPGLYFIGEVVDVTGHLGGHNFQWAWASGFAAGQHV